MKIKLKKQQNGFLLTSTQSNDLEQIFRILCNEEELELLPISKNSFLLLTKSGFEEYHSINTNPKNLVLDSNSKKSSNKNQQNISLSEEQNAVLQKLLKIKFSSRVYPYIQKVFSQKEKEVLNSLIKIGAVSIYKSNKYPQGVYTIDDSFFHKRLQKNLSPLEFLEKFGYIVFPDLENAKKFLEQNKEKLEKLKVKTKRGYDKKFYFCLPAFLEEKGQQILELLNQPKSTSELSEKLKIPSDGVNSVLIFLAEDGAIFEKPNGKWQKA
jgi:hypothetical protein